MARKTLGRYGLPGHAHIIKMRDLSGMGRGVKYFVELSCVIRWTKGKSCIC